MNAYKAWPGIKVFPNFNVIETTVTILMYSDMHIHTQQQTMVK